MILEGVEDKAVEPRRSRALRDAARWLLACAESFPVPIEEALWVEDFRHAAAGERAVTRSKLRP
jgi:hypothetical protein